MITTTDMRDAYLAAEKAVLQGLSFRLGDRQLTRANLPEIIAGRKEWEARAAAEAAMASGRSNGYALASFDGCHR